jgi:hypothetical protein
MVDLPLRAAAVAAIIPAGPPPTTTTSNSPYTGVVLLGSTTVRGPASRRSLTTWPEG